MENEPITKKIKILLVAIATLWIIETIDLFFLHGFLDNFGVRPRSTFGLVGILAAPFLHGGFEHLSSNAAPLFFLGLLTMGDSIKQFYQVITITSLIAGAGTWLIGPSQTVHLGASGVVFGLFGYLLLRGFFHRSVGKIILSIFIACGYGGMIWGVFPTQPGVSWQMHLFGFLGGILCARNISRREANSRYSYNYN